MPLSDHRDQQRDWDVLSPDRRPRTYRSEAVCLDIHVTSWATSVL